MDYRRASPLHQGASCRRRFPRPAGSLGRRSPRVRPDRAGRERCRSLRLLLEGLREGVVVSGWIAPELGEVDGPAVGPDRPMLEGYHAYQRRTFRNICAGLTAEQLASRPLPSTNLSLLGLARHLAKVERVWLRIRAGREQIE